MVSRVVLEEVMLVLVMSSLMQSASVKVVTAPVLHVRSDGDTDKRANERMDGWMNVRAGGQSMSHPVNQYFDT